MSAGETVATYVILQPRSNTNTSDQYRVVDFDDWQQGGLLYGFTPHKTYEAAKQDADTRNRTALTPSA
ncbi:hypothetical protein AB0I95_15110 [Micromonospora sp. NPDC049751]|uniref:hypothetical protein n=1 Tax=Micromonospora sp. NPDC049751 TaxID=3154837 RepID=UPI0033DED533